MPDIVLVDGSGEAQTYAGTTALGVDKADGGIAVFVSEEMLPAQYQHPSTHPASMITGLAPVATEGTFDKLYKKPFCDLPKLEETELAFKLAFEDIELYTSETLSGAWEDIEGETYTITWDGTPYTCVCKNIKDVEDLNSTGVLYFGNIASYLTALGATVTVEDTGEPFVISMQHDYDYPELMGDIAIATTDSSATHRISIIPDREAKPLDVKYLPDEAATKEFVEEAIAGIEVSGGSGGVTGEVDILPEQELVFISDNPDDASASFFWDGDDAWRILSEIKAGENYTMVFDGVKYEFTPVDGSANLPSSYVIRKCWDDGNGSLAFSSASDTGEPFFAMFYDYDAYDDAGVLQAEVRKAGIVVAPGIMAESVTHTVRIYQAACTISWNNVTDKPFYEEEKTYFEYPESTIPFSCNGDSYEGVTPLNDEMLSAINSEWSYANVLWDGVKYTREIQYRAGAKCLGNLSWATGGEDDGTPFCIVLDAGGVVSGTPKAIIWAVYDPIEGVTEETTAEDGTVTTTTTYPEKQHTVGITLLGKVVKKIEEKYQHQTDWEETDDTKATFLQNKPFGEIIEAGTVLINRDCYFDADDFGFLLFDLNTMERFADTSKVIEGGTYLITAGDYQFVGTGVSGDTIISLYPYYAEPGIESGIVSVEVDAQGAPKDVVVFGVAGILDFIDLGDTTAYVTDASYPVNITLLDATKKIDQKYLPYGTNCIPGEKITSFTAANVSTIEGCAEEAAALANVGLYGFRYSVPSADDYWTESKFTTGETYAITIGDKIHYAEAKNFEDERKVVFGNLAILKEAAEASGESVTSIIPDTGEDFVVASIDIDGVPSGGFYVYSRTNYGDSVSIAIYSTTKEVTQIESKYIPGPPFFDLTAMGLPDLTMDGTHVSVECDTTELRAALENNVVKVSFTMAGFVITGVLTAMKMSGSYQGGYIGIVGGTPYLLSIIVNDGSLESVVKPLAVQTSTTT